MRDGVHQLPRVPGDYSRERILDYIVDHYLEHGYTPTVREIGDAVGLRSSSTVQNHLQQLAHRGLLVRLADGQSRGWLPPRSVCVTIRTSELDRLRQLAGEEDTDGQHGYLSDGSRPRALESGPEDGAGEVREPH